MANHQRVVVAKGLPLGTKDYLPDLAANASQLRNVKGDVPFFLELPRDAPPSCPPKRQRPERQSSTPSWRCLLSDRRDFEIGPRIRSLHPKPALAVTGRTTLPAIVRAVPSRT